MILRMVPTLRHDAKWDVTQVPVSFVCHQALLASSEAVTRLERADAHSFCQARTTFAMYPSCTGFDTSLNVRLSFSAQNVENFILSPLSLLAEPCFCAKKEASFTGGFLPGSWSPTCSRRTHSCGDTTSKLRPAARSAGRRSSLQENVFGLRTL